MKKIETVCAECGKIIYIAARYFKGHGAHKCKKHRNESNQFGNQRGYKQ